MLILYLLVLIPAAYWVIKTLGPEMAKPPLPKIVPKPYSFDFSHSNEPDQRIEKLETLLAEKNRNIQLLQKELKIFHVQIRGFEKVKSLLVEEIHHLKEQNRIFRSELGLPAAQPKEHSIT